jgi:NAD(P)-dependent dehydrogenase (short-subunit alcohol dehydrogenase family)
MRTEEIKAITLMQSQDEAADTSMKGKTVLFTGASRGMGRFAAIELARRGAQILIVGHNDARGAAAVEAISGSGGSAAFLRADMGDAQDVCALAESVLARSGSIDVLIHSAGGLPPSAARTREGVDRGFAQNFLGAFLLTRLLEERLLASAPARVIAVGSSTHRMVKQVDLDVLMRPGKAPGTSYQRGNYQMLSYQTAKLAVITWIYGLARRWGGRGVTANVLDPGMVKGEFGEQFEGPAPIRLMLTRIAPFFVAVGKERASGQYVRLAADPALMQVSGRYFVSGEEKQGASSPLSLDPVVQKCINDAAEVWAAPFLRGRV